MKGDQCILWDKLQDIAMKYIDHFKFSSSSKFKLFDQAE